MARSARHSSDDGTGFVALLRNGYFWGGLGVLGLAAAVLYVVFNFFVMPAYTRHGVSVEVPDVRRLPYADAADLLVGRGLRVERVVQRYNAAFGRDAVMDQDPRPGARVKPNRPIFLTVNSGTPPMVVVPSLEGLSLREASNRLAALGLRLGGQVPDTIPSRYPNTVTRLMPAPGDSLPEGSAVFLFYSTGLGSALVAMPDVTGLTADEAERILLEHKLRAVVVGGPADTTLTGAQPVVRQSREPGTEVREGEEVRLFLDEAPEEPTE